MFGKNMTTTFIVTCCNKFKFLYATVHCECQYLKKF